MQLEDLVNQVTKLYEERQILLKKQEEDKKEYARLAEEAAKLREELGFLQRQKEPDDKRDLEWLPHSIVDGKIMAVQHVQTGVTMRVGYPASTSIVPTIIDRFEQNNDGTITAYLKSKVLP